MELIYHFPEKNDLQFGPQMSNLKVAALAMHRRLSHGLNQILQLCTPLNPMGKEPLPEVLRFPGRATDIQAMAGWWGPTLPL